MQASKKSTKWKFGLTIGEHTYKRSLNVAIGKFIKLRPRRHFFFI